MRSREIELTGATMGIVGFGGTGRAMAKRAQAFGMDCLAVDRDAVPTAHGVKEVWLMDQFMMLLRNSDVVSICCPLTSETEELFDTSVFAAMKESAILVNVTRGAVMQEQALIAALQSDEIAGAALDVAPREPLPANSALWSMPNVVMSPHTAGASQFRAQRNMDRFVSNLERMVKDEPLEGLIDKALGY